jgi:hypothetical protein
MTIIGQIYTANGLCDVGTIELYVRAKTYAQAKARAKAHFTASTSMRAEKCRATPGKGA